MREVKDFLTFADASKLQGLIKALSLQVGNLVNFQELCQTTALDFKTFFPKEQKLYYRRTKAGVELDFILGDCGMIFSE